MWNTERNSKVRDTIKMEIYQKDDPLVQIWWIKPDFESKPWLHHLQTVWFESNSLPSLFQFLFL